jgi:hypothetical protein
MTRPDINEPPMPAEATRSLFLWASGFGVGALLVLGGFIFLVGIGTLGHDPANAPAAQSAAQSPATPAPKTSSPSPTTSPSQTTGQAPQPETTGQAPKGEPDKPARPAAPAGAPKPGANRS